MNTFSEARVCHPLGLGLTLSVLLALIPHLLTLPLLLNAFVMVVLGWYGLHSYKGVKLPNRLLKLVFFITAILLIFTIFGFRFTQHLSITLLAIMLSLKIFEIKDQLDRRNTFIVIYLCLFLIGSHFLNNQSIFMIIYNSLALILLIGLLVAYNRLPQPIYSLRETLHKAGPILIQAIPLAIIFFLFFPRISEPLWSLPDDNLTSYTGLSDSMFPGQITKLADNDAVAFRVVFHNNIPGNQNLYWRGPVITKTDGYVWSRYSDQDKRKLARDRCHNMLHRYSCSRSRL